jgi:RNA polymerase-interacting CarD/CdnL/TRCF family regulator
MSRPDKGLRPGDPVFHPRFGLGRVRGLSQRDRIRPVGEPVVADPGANAKEDYYDIELVEGGMLEVPVSRADRVGLRRACNGLEAVTSCLCSDAQSLPADARERAATLRIREQNPLPESLALAVRDMIAQSQGRTLSAGERTWLDKACLRLSAEAALVDGISMVQARSAVWGVVTELRTAFSAA